MKIVIDLQAAQSVSRFHGIGRYSLALTKMIAQQAGNHEIWLALNSSFPETIDALRVEFKELIPPERIKIFETLRIIGEYDPSQAAKIKISKKLRENFLINLSPDIIHISSLFEGWMDSAITSIDNLNNHALTSVTLYDLIPLINSERYLYDDKITRFYFNKLQEVKKANLLLAISSSAQQEAIHTLSISPDRVINCSAGVDEKFKVYTVSKPDRLEVEKRYGINRKFIFYVGGFDLRKNIESLLEAYRLLTSPLKKNYQLVITGKRLEHTDYEAQLRARFKLSHNELIITGYIPDNELIILYNSCSLFVYPSLHEGFGLPILEAMACGAAVICSNSSSLLELIGCTQALFDPTKPSCIANKITAVLTNSALYYFLKEHNQKQAKKFTWAATAKKVLTSFEKLQEDKKNQHIKSHHIAYLNASHTTKKMAFVSPLPPQKTGIANYSLQLLPELARFYEIVIILEKTQIDNKWLKSNFTIQDTHWFTQHAPTFDVILYQFGNSPAHHYMFKLLADYPGIVVLHDFFLSGLVHYADVMMPSEKDCFYRALYESHGFSACHYQVEKGREATLSRYPCNLAILKRARGVIVHSQHAINLAFKWYKFKQETHIRQIPQVRLKLTAIDRETARKKLKLSKDDFIVCSFGFISPHKLSQRIVSSWLDSSLAKSANTHLIFVGENHVGDYGEQLTSQINASKLKKQIQITGFIELELFESYLAAADMAIQLRETSQGETSACIISCLSYGIPMIINAHGSADEFPNNVAIKIKENFTNNTLKEAMNRLYENTLLCEQFSENALEYINKNHHPTKIGEKYQEVIEYFLRFNPISREKHLINDLVKNKLFELEDENIQSTASIIAANRPSIGLTQLLVDISILVHCDEKTGIQRVVRGILVNLLIHPPEGFRTEPIYDNGKGQYFYARRFTSRILQFSDTILQDSAVETYPGDIFLGLDFCPTTIPHSKTILSHWRNRGIKLYFMLYDILPILRPNFFPIQTKPTFSTWLNTISEIADGVICTSRQTTDEFLTWLYNALPNRLVPLKISFFYLGANIAPTIPSLNPHFESNPFTIKTSLSFLLVGRIEPRKGHLQTLNAFNQLWSKGQDVSLIIVGRQGWMVEELMATLLRHPEYGKRLIWLNNACDKTLSAIYQQASALILASEGEGFGLPLMESAQYKLSIIARELPIFKELAKDNAFYFNGLTAHDLSRAIEDWIVLRSKGQEPKAHSIKWSTWQESSQALIDILLNERWTDYYTPNTRNTYDPHLLEETMT
ncbi:glycosyltransferase [Rickettsiella endosymbiont of Dermanyssus gallinae]|uniref:glycosyltransferase n=1 Tax=Rickettsiella endosymbiont of Dermanyssus gallinae TaxID=2856608 RepID=UPI001C527596|nr:glycosyltransferase [Rickettsiella endosymbiont of Dermanyssus gallinae]